MFKRCWGAVLSRCGWTTTTGRDINARYNVGGWPTTAFLTPHGGLIGGATYLPPDQFLAMLMELEGAYRADKPQLYAQSRDLWQRRREQARRAAAGAEVESGLADRVSRIVAGGLRCHIRRVRQRAEVSQPPPHCPVYPAPVPRH